MQELVVCHPVTADGTAPSRSEVGSSLQLVHRSRPVTLPGRPLTQFELTAYAEFLAIEFRYNARQAADLLVTWYQEQIGADICSQDDAATLRLQVMYLCREKQHLPMPVLRDTQALVGPPEIVTYPLHGDTATPSFFGRLTGRITEGINWAYEGERPSPWNLAKTVLIGLGCAIGVYLIAAGVFAL